MPRESLAKKRARAELLLDGLQRLYPDARTELEFGDPFQLLVATMLSAQATDVSVNKATPALFRAHPNAASLAVANPVDVEPYIRTIGLYRTKAKNLVAASRILVDRHDGAVPGTLAELIDLPGVGRKTANVVLANAFQQNTIAVDTHVGRLARRLGLSKHTDPDKVEADLQKVFPSHSWVFLHHALILHGRRVCKARAPACSDCSLCENCPACGTFGNTRSGSTAR